MGGSPNYRFWFGQKTGRRKNSLMKKRGRKGTQKDACQEMGGRGVGGAAAPSKIEMSRNQRRSHLSKAQEKKGSGEANIFSNEG